MFSEDQIVSMFEFQFKAVYILVALYVHVLLHLFYVVVSLCFKL